MKNHRGIAAALTLLFAGAAWAHNYVADDGSHTSAGEALYLRDVSLSQVLYHDVTPDTAQLWIAFDGKAGDLFYFQLGVPYLTRLENYRPALVFAGPGLENVKPPIAIPAGLGAQAYTSDEITPTFFDEPFTGTQSWVMFEKEIPLPRDGRYYLADYDPAGQPGKLWVAVGKREAWTFKDILTLYQVQDKVRAFHEVGHKPMPLFTFVISTVSRILRALFFFV